jgi:AraC-like DNA-binding protein
MLSLASPAEFLASPIGRYTAGRTFAVWCHAPELTGTMMWGTPDDRDIREMVEVLDFVHHADISPARRALVDCSGVERIDADTAMVFSELARTRVAGWSSRTGRHAIVVPRGLAGILAAGSWVSVSPAHPVRFVHRVEEAFAFLAHPDAPAVHAEACTIVDAARGRDALLGRLRAHLAREMVNPSMPDCASALGMSARTMQRELARLRTSFSDELRRVRVTAASELLELSDLKIESIAARVGFGSASRLSAMVRRERNATPSEVREAARARRDAAVCA